MMVAALAIAFCSVGPPARAEESPLAKYVGRWDVRVKTLQPQKLEITYIETYEWVLRRKFVKGTTQNKPDGSEDVVFAGYDQKTKGYPFWIFSSTGTYLYLAPAAWDARQRIMTWDNPPQMDLSYRGRCTFPDDNTRRCTVLVKDWKGKVLLEQETSAVRRKD